MLTSKCMDMEKYNSCTHSEIVKQEMTQEHQSYSELMIKRLSK